MTAVRQVQNAGYWISQDAQMAQEVDTADDPGTPELELVTLTWTVWVDETEHVVTYAMVGDELQREFVIRDANGVEIGSGTTIVARYVDLANTSSQWSGGVLTVTVTAAVGSYPEAVSETRVYEITPRPGMP